MTTTPTPAETMIIDAKLLAQQLHDFAKTIAHMSETLSVMADSPEELWVREYGEAVTSKRAAEIIGRTPQTISNMTRAGTLARTPDGNILIRDLARWANSMKLKQEREKMPPLRLASR